MPPRNEFSRVVALDPWPEGGLVFDETATADERAALAARFDLIGLPRLRVSGTVEPGAGGSGFVVRADLDAEVIQRCVVTLEPVTARIREPFERRYGFGADPPGVAPGGVVEVDPDEDEVEPLLGPVLDLGELAAEALVLALDPYPRAPDADAVVERYAPQQPVDAAGPLTALRQRLSS